MARPKRQNATETTMSEPSSPAPVKRRGRPPGSGVKKPQTSVATSLAQIQNNPQGVSDFLAEIRTGTARESLISWCLKQRENIEGMLNTLGYKPADQDLASRAGA